MYQLSWYKWSSRNLHTHRRSLAWHAWLLRGGLCVAGVWLGDIHAAFAWQAWHYIPAAFAWQEWLLRHWAVSGGALGPRWSPGAPCQHRPSLSPSPQSGPTLSGSQRSSLGNASRHSGHHFFGISTSKSGPRRFVFKNNFRHLKFQKWSDTWDGLKTA